MMNLSFSTLSALFFSLIISVLVSCSTGSKSSDPSETSENDSTTSGTGETDTRTLADFDGSASSAELVLMLSNTDLNCSSGDTLSFDGTNWVCANGDVVTSADDAPSAMHVDANGHVGMNTSTPQAVLHAEASATSDGVVGLFTQSNAPNGYVRIQNAINTTPLPTPRFNFKNEIEGIRKKK